MKLLVSNGADINQRATGRFFLPEDQKNGRSEMTDYNGKTEIMSHAHRPLSLNTHLSTVLTFNMYLALMILSLRLQ